MINYKLFSQNQIKSQLIPTSDRLRFLHSALFARIFQSSKNMSYKPIKFLNRCPMDRDMFMKYLTDNGIGCAVHYPLPIFAQPLYRDLGYTEKIAKCPVTSDLVNRVLSLPVHPLLSEEDLNYIVETINNFEAII